ncbi:ATP-dependent metallopeptidase FtsH/Yme1/Tma family protein [Candidatus Amesbacteria bacterium]|nr:ATP-dependent metallopeptidase FtsH/Yme1/Tma family protein [Candidatus Amesbacteria bacterium]
MTEKKNGNGKKPIKGLMIQMNFNIQNVLWFLVIGAMIFSLFQLWQSGNKIVKEVQLSQALSDIKEQKIEKVEVFADRLALYYKDKKGEVYFSRKEANESLTQILERAKIDSTSVKYEIKDQTMSQIIAQVIPSLIGTGFVVLILLYMMRQARGAQDSLFSFGNSKAKLFAKGKLDVKFADIAGVDEAKRELEEVVDFLKNPAKYKAVGARTPKGVLLVGPSGVGKCVTGDTIVWTNKGLMEIREIPRYYYVNQRSHRVYGAGIAGLDTDKVVSTREFASHWYNLGEQKTFKLKLDQGYTLEGTPEHPVIVMGKDGKLRFRKLSEVHNGDYVAIQYGQNMFGDLNIVDTDTAYLMGLLTGDGNMSHASRVGLTNVDSEIINFFIKYVGERFPESKISFREQSYLVSNGGMKKMLYEMGMSYLLSFDKSVPATILQARKEIQTVFLRGLFDTDASVEKNRATVEYTTVSEKMAKQVQMMLLNLGVVAYLNIKGRVEDGYPRPVYRLNITGSAFVEFRNQVGFGLKRKQTLLEQHVVKMGKVNTNIDVIPYVGGLVEEAWRVLSLKKLSNERLSRTIDKVRNRDRMSRQTMGDFLAHVEKLDVNLPHVEYLRDLVEANIFFSRAIDKVASIAEVYDFTVPSTHSFVGNGFINHNTLMAKAVAGEANVPFFSMAGSEFMEMLVGVGSARVRDLFATAKKSAPSIIFIDEIDAIGRQRGHGTMGGHDEREQTLNQILVEMDGFTSNDLVMVMAATNRGDLLDPALLRPGRFDRRVMVDYPDIEGRKSILAIYAKNKPFAPDVNWDHVAKRTVGFSGADLENMLNEAAIGAARESKTQITMIDLEEAATKVKMGPQKKRTQSDDDRKMTAYHEVGHAITTWAQKNMDPVHRISIVSRGMSLGHTLVPPKNDIIHMTKTKLLSQITMMMGGRAAEELVFGEITTGASNDIDKATSVARNMVMEYGMSALGPINYGPQQDAIDWGRVYFEQTQISPDMQNKIDAEVKKIIDTAYKNAVTILKKYKKKMDKVVVRLLETENMDGDEFEKLMK